MICTKVNPVPTNGFGKFELKNGSASVEELKERVRHIKSLSTLDKDETLRLRLEHVGPSVALFFPQSPLKMVQGRGQYLYDELGNEYLDCINNVAHVGHGNQNIALAISKQLSLLNTNSRFLHDNLSIYAKRLTSLFPSHLNVCFLVNSGSEANDLAMRLARAYTHKKDICSLDGAYHGNLTSTMAISPYKTRNIHNYKKPKWAHVMPLPCAYRGQFNRHNIKELKESLSSYGELSGKIDDDQLIGFLYGKQAAEMMEQIELSQGRQIAALFVESMVSCGGQTPLPKGYLNYLQNECLHKSGKLLVCDEVQTGFGRSGKHMWAFQLYGSDIRPDIVTVGKPMGNGFPVAAVVTRLEIAQAFSEIGTEYFNTFGGNPASCAAALAVLDEIEHKNLIQNADRVGSYMLKRLKELEQNKSEIVLGDVRGCGFFIGMDIVESKKDPRRIEAPHHAKHFVNKFREANILMSTEGKLGNILKFKPPMTFSMSDAERFLTVFESSLAELEQKIKAEEKQ